MGPLLTVSQFKRFMEVIRKLGDRVEKEHDQHLRDSQRIDDQSYVSVNGTRSAPSTNGAMDFESLVSQGGAGTVKADTIIDSSQNWDDVWGTIFTSGAQTPVLQSPAISPPGPSMMAKNQSLPTSPNQPSFATSAEVTPARAGLDRSTRGLGVAPIPSTSFDAASSAQPVLPMTSSPSQYPQQKTALSMPMIPQTQRTAPPATVTPPAQQWQAPNYNISLDRSAPSAPLFASQHTPTQFSSPHTMSNVLLPSKPAQPQWPGIQQSKQLSKADWGDFDPLA